jgi:hypothetical protein
VANSKLMNVWMMVDALNGRDKQRITSGLLELVMPPKSVKVLVPEASPGGGYSAYKRVR